MDLFKIFKKPNIERVEEIVDRLEKALHNNKQERFYIESNLRHYRSRLEKLKSDKNGKKNN